MNGRRSLPAGLLLVTLPLTIGAAERRGGVQVFPGARCDAAETAALAAPDGRGPSVYRTSRPFSIVLNYYRFKAKQSVQVNREDVGARFLGIARALDRPVPPPGIFHDAFVARFTRAIAPRAGSPADAAAAWHAYARRYSGRAQQIGEGERVTIYRPYLSQRTFELIDQTFFILREPGGPCNDRLTADHRPDARLRGGARRGNAGADRH